MNPVCAEEFALTFETAVTFVFFVSSKIVLCMNFTVIQFMMLGVGGCRIKKLKLLIK